jgi:glycosyltransferase involved in cell wall biosynthesis
LFGGDRGAMLLEFVRALHKPIVLTLHTTVPDPDAAVLELTQNLCRRADLVMTLTETSKRIVETHYGVDPAKVCVVMHGVPDVPEYHGPFFKTRIGLGESCVLSTFGLLSRGKGIETIIDALPAIIERRPNVVYTLWGETHPQVRRSEGEQYRMSLLERARQRRVEDRVRFFDRYMTDDEVIAALLATDIYVSPSLDPHQAVSGTLSYAIACGRATIATEYQYASELLADGRGITVPFRDPRALAQAVEAVLADDRLRATLESEAYSFGRSMTWEKIALGYRKAFFEAQLAGLGVLLTGRGA